MKINLKMAIFLIGLIVKSYSLENHMEQIVQKYIGDNNYTKIVRNELVNNDKKQLIAIMFTNKNCQTCDIFQPQLIQIQQSFRQQSIQIFRCQISDNKMMSQKFKIKRFPLLHFVYKKPSTNKQKFEIQIYKTTQILTQSIVQTAKYLKRVIKYCLKIEQNNQFLQTLAQIPQTNRIIVNIQALNQIYEVKEDYLIKNIALDQNFDSLLVVPLSKQLYQFYLIKYDFLTQNCQNKQNPLIVIALKDQKQYKFTHIPILTKQFNQLVSFNLNIDYILKSFLFNSVQQLTENLFNTHQQIASTQNKQIPIYLAILDSIWNRKQSQKHIIMLNHILKTFENQVLIFWTEGQINSQKKVQLGFQKNSKPPMFGKLIFTKNQFKSPLKSLSSNNPIFKQSQIIKKIRTDLGYEKLLAQKINSTLEDMNLNNLIQINSNIQTSQNSQEIIFAYCTSNYISVSQLQQIQLLIKRFKRFYPHSSFKILTQPCFINNQLIQNGLYFMYKNFKQFVTEKITSCFQMQNKIQQVTSKLAFLMNRKKLIPNNLCVIQQQMRDFLISLQK